jgi:hypothetical protein
VANFSHPFLFIIKFADIKLSISMEDFKTKYDRLVAIQRYDQAFKICQEYITNDNRKKITKYAESALVAMCKNRYMKQPIYVPEHITYDDIIDICISCGVDKMTLNDCLRVKGAEIRLIQKDSKEIQVKSTWWRKVLFVIFGIIAPIISLLGAVYCSVYPFLQSQYIYNQDLGTKIQMYPNFLFDGYSEHGVGFWILFALGLLGATFWIPYNTWWETSRNTKLLKYEIGNAIISKYCGE